MQSQDLPVARLCALLIVAVAGAVLLAVDTDRAHAQIDISGEWTATLEGDIPATCHIRFEQSGADLSAILTCAGFGQGSLSGTIGPDTGDFSAGGSIGGAAGGGIPIEVEGSYSDVADSIDGRWTALGAIKGTFRATRNAGKEPGVQLAGAWDVDFSHGISGSCTASVDQYEQDLSATLECTDLDGGTLAGVASPAGVSLAGTVAGREIEMAVGISGDGSVMSGSWNARTGIGSGVVTWMRGGERLVPADITGRWAVSITGPVPMGCAAAVEQTGEELYGVADCSLATGPLEGSIDTESGTFELHGAADILARVSADGSTIAGTWRLSSSFSGMLSGRRTSGTLDLVDLSGDWRLALDGELSAHCTANATQSWEDVQMTADCGERGSGSFEGSIGPLEGERLQLSGSLGGLQMYLSGEASLEAGTMGGSWHAEPLDDDADGLGAFGCFAGRRDGGGEPLTCEPPSHHPLVQLGGSIVPAMGGGDTGIRPKPATLDVDSGRRYSFGALAGLGLALVALAAWRFRLQR